MTIHISYDMLGLLVGLFLFGLCVGVGGGWAAYTWRRARPVAPEFDLVGILEESLVAIYVVLEGRVLYVNKAMRNLLRYDDVSEIVGRQAMDFTLPADHRLFQEMHQKRMSGEMGIGSYSYRALCKDGVALPISVTGGMVNYKGALALVGMAYDATAQWEAERKSNLANQVFNSAAEGIIITDANFKIEAVNPAFTEITGYQSCESVGRISNLLRGRHRDPHFQERLREILEHKGHWVGEMQDRRKNGQWYPAWLSISTVYDHARNASNFVYVFTDHTRRKETETRLLDLASRDSLTGLYNRASFLDGLDRRIQEGQAHQRRLAVYFIDLDRFKGVNDTLGHEIGDLLLIEIATRMRSTLREHDMAARIGGDEFVVVFDDMQSTEHAIQVAKRLIAALVRPTKIKEHEIFVTASIGWATCPEDGVTADELLRNADIAMYQAKAGGRDSYCAFHEEMIGPTKRRVNIESKLLRALDRGEFTLVY